MTALHLDPTCPGWQPLAHAPGRYIVGRSAEYVHLPRSLAVGPHGAIAQSWCGQSHRMSGSARWANDYDPDVHVLCGTCLGRALGYTDQQPAVAFRPTRTLNSLARYRHCPGPRLDLFVELDDRNGFCILCGHVGRVNANRGWNAWGCHLEPHRPAVETALVYCPSCGYRDLVVHDGVVSCRAWQCTFSRVAAA